VGKNSELLMLKAGGGPMFRTGRDCIPVKYNAYQCVVRSLHSHVRDTVEVNLHFHIGYHYYNEFMG
jgi:hypothetical protein